VAGTDVQFSESFEIEGGRDVRTRLQARTEGAVSKVRDGGYASGRGNNRVKKTCA
jgi:bifunctional non-homologous end joining protein LigD